MTRTATALGDQQTGWWRTPTRVGVEEDSEFDGGMGVMGAKGKRIKEVGEAEGAGDGKKGWWVPTGGTYTDSNLSDDRSQTRLPVCNENVGDFPCQKKEYNIPCLPVYVSSGKMEETPNFGTKPILSVHLPN